MTGLVICGIVTIYTFGFHERNHTKKLEIFITAEDKYYSQFPL